MQSAVEVLVRNVRPLGQPLVDIAITNGRIIRIGPGVGDELTADEIFDGAGMLVFPGLIDAHTHMDKTLLGLPWHRNEVGPALVDMIENERRVRREEDIDFHTQSLRHARAAIAVGTTHIRSHVDIDTEVGLRAFHGVQQTQQDMAPYLTIQTVAFPQSGMLVRPGTVELLEQALRDGADVIGGLDPCSIDRDPKGHLDVIFGLADRYGVEVDIHIHEPGELGTFSIDLALDRTEALGMQGRVVLSHAFALGQVDQARLEGLIERILALDVAVMTHAPGGHRDIPNFKQLRAAGVRLCTGNDGIQDAWNPLQRPDMLERAYIIAYRNNLRRDDDLENVIDVVTCGNARILGDDSYGLAAGNWADLVLVPGENHVAAVVERRPRAVVMKRGVVTAREGVAVV